MNFTAHAAVPAENRLIDADTTDLTAIRRQDVNAGRFPANQPYTGRAVVPSSDDRYAEGYADGLNRALTADRELVDLAARRNPIGVHLMAEAIRNGCPPWCSEDHRGQPTEVDGFSMGLVHERTLADITAEDPSWNADHAATARVLVESTTERGEVITPTRVVVSIAEGAEGHYPGSEDTQGWTGTPEQARKLAAALLAAAELVDGGAR